MNHHAMQAAFRYPTTLAGIALLCLIGNGSAQQADRTSSHSSTDALLLEGIQLPNPNRLPEAGDELEAYGPYGPADLEDPTAVLRHISRQMHSAARGLTDARRTTTTLQRQDMILNELRGILQLLDAKRAGGGSAAAGPKGSQTSDARGTGQSDRPQGGSGQSVKGAVSPLKPAAGAALDNPPTAENDYVRRAWGSLPVRNLERLRALQQVDFLPGYEHVISDYFKRMAEDER